MSTADSPSNAIVILHPAEPCPCGTTTPGWRFLGLGCTIQGGLSIGETSSWECTTCFRGTSVGRLRRDNLDMLGLIERTSTGHSPEPEES